MTAIILAACNSAPTPYKEAEKMIKNGKFENAIEMLKKVTIEDEEWLDSAMLKRAKTWG